MRIFLMLITATLFGLGSLACNDFDQIDTRPGTGNHGGANTSGGPGGGGHSASANSTFEDYQNNPENMFTGSEQATFGQMKNQSYTQPIDVENDRSLNYLENDPSFQEYEPDEDDEDQF